MGFIRNHNSKSKEGEQQRQKDSEWVHSTFHEVGGGRAKTNTATQWRGYFTDKIVA